MAIDTMDETVAALSLGQLRRPFVLASAAPKAAGTYFSYRSVAGSPGAQANGGIGTGGAIPTNASGRFRFSNPTSPALTYLAQVSMSAANYKALTIYDRLWHNSGLSGTTAPGAQTISGATVNRGPTNVGEGAQIWIEWYTATGASASNITVSYTNSAGTSGRTTPSQAFTVSPVAGQMQYLPLQSGDVGVNSIQSATLSATTGTLGDWGLVILRPIYELALISNECQERDLFDMGYPQILDNACLDLLALESSTATGVFKGHIVLMQG